MHYLPAINKSPTRLDTVQEMLNQVKAKADKLNQNCTDPVLDHAIYSKVVEVINDPQNASLREAVNLRMGGFHACGIFLAVIGKRFGSAGVQDLIVEVGLAGSDSTENILKGKHYNRGVRVAKYVYEALQRSKLEMFEKWLQDQNKDDLLLDFVESEIFTKVLKERKSEYLNESLDAIDGLCAALEEFDKNLTKFTMENSVPWQPFGRVTLTWCRSYLISPKQSVLVTGIFICKVVNEC